MKKFGLIGDPIATSLSPALFKAAYGDEYSYSLIEGNDFSESWQKFTDFYDGINVTAPFKTLALSKADLCTSYCGKTGAANIIVKTDKGLLADNSDFTGIILSICQAYFPGLIDKLRETYGDAAHIKAHQYFRQAAGAMFARKPIALIVGCGGAGMAAAVATAELGFNTAIMNRSEDKAAAFSARLPEYNFIIDRMSDFKDAFRECDLMIYTLPVRLDAIDTLDAADYEGEDRYKWPRPSKVILEANYKTPAFDRKRVEEFGAQYISGKTWLFYQALTGYGRLTGKSPNLKEMERVIYGDPK